MQYLDKSLSLRECAFLPTHAARIVIREEARYTFSNYVVEVNTKELSCAGST